MSQYDDANNYSAVTIAGPHWIPFVSGSALFSVAPTFEALETPFLYCGRCYAHLDPWDICVGNFGDMQCGFCGSEVC